jgi:hypothetical protein
MNRKHIFLVGVVVLTMGGTLIASASARPLTKSPIVTGTPDLVDRWMQRQTPAAPDLVERYVQRLPAAAFYTPAAIKAYGLRMQAMTEAYRQQSTTVASTSNGFDVRDGLVGAASGLGLVVCFAALLFVVTRNRRPQVAV